MGSFISVLVVIFVVIRFITKSRVVQNARPGQGKPTAGTVPGAPAASLMARPAAKPAAKPTVKPAARQAPAQPRSERPMAPRGSAAGFEGASGYEGASSREGGDFTWQHNKAYDMKSSGGTQAARRRSGIRAAEMRKAVIVKEILDKPVSMRS